MSKKMEKKAEKMRSSENRKTTMSRIQLHRLARLASLLKRNGYHSPADILEEYYSLEHVDGLVPHDRYCIRTVFRDVQILKEEFHCPLAYDRRNKGYYLKHHGWDFNCPADLSESALLALIIGAKIAEDVIPEPLKGKIKIAVDEILKGNNPDFLDTTLVNSLLVFAESGATDISAIFLSNWFSIHFINFYFVQIKSCRICCISHYLQIFFNICFLLDCTILTCLFTFFEN